MSVVQRIYTTASHLSKEVRAITESANQRLADKPKVHIERGRKRAARVGGRTLGISVATTKVEPVQPIVRERTNGVRFHSGFSENNVRNINLSPFAGFGMPAKVVNGLDVRRLNKRW